MNLIRHGWIVHDIVTFVKEWCDICTKARMHEIESGGHKLCLSCYSNTAPAESTLQPPALELIPVSSVLAP